MDFTFQINIVVPFTAKNEEQADERMEAIEAWVLDPKNNKEPRFLNGDVEVLELTVEEA